MNALIYSFIVTAALFSGIYTGRQKRRVFPYLTLSITALIVCAFVFQSAHPEILSQLERNAIRIREGQWWRIVTAFFFQDGGVPGFVFNSVGFMMIGTLAEQEYHRREWMAVLVTSVLLAQFVALLWQPIGAGNSIGVFGLAGSMGAVAFFSQKSLKAKRAIAFALLSVILAAWLIFQKDIHGVAFFAGMASALMIQRIRIKHGYAISERES